MDPEADWEVELDAALDEPFEAEEDEDEEELDADVEEEKEEFDFEEFEG